MDEAGINPLPNMTQINNKIANLRKKRGLNDEITTTVELEEILSKYREVPEDEDADKPFVKDYKIEVLPCGRKARFWFLITTHNLMKRLKNNPVSLFQIDGTYKLIWVPEKQKEGWCVQVLGTSNLVNEFFPTGLAVTSEETAVTYREIITTLETTFKFIMADGAKAITKGKLDALKPATFVNVDGTEVDPERGMCYPHVQRNVKNKLAGIEKNFVNEILDDIAAIQLSQNREEFDQANMMFYFKWLSLDVEKINEFIGYYHETWVNLTESNWFVGAGPIDHNNGIEGTNADIKKTKVLRDKQKLGAFINNAISIVEGWSKKDDSRLYCDKSNLVSLVNQTEGFQFISRNTSKTSILKIRGKYYTLSSKAPDGSDIKEEVKKFIKYKENMDYPEGFDEWKAVKGSVYELEEDGEFFKCSCGAGQKKYFCKHNIGLSIKFKNYVIPDTAKSVPLAQKRKRGRPTKNKGWWSKQ